MCTVVITDSIAVGIHVIAAGAVVKGAIIANAISIGIRILGTHTAVQADPCIYSISMTAMHTCGKRRCRSNGQDDSGRQHSQQNSFHKDFLPIGFRIVFCDFTLYTIEPAESFHFFLTEFFSGPVQLLSFTPPGSQPSWSSAGVS